MSTSIQPYTLAHLAAAREDLEDSFGIPEVVRHRAIALLDDAASLLQPGERRPPALIVAERSGGVSNVVPFVPRWQLQQRKAVERVAANGIEDLFS